VLSRQARVADVIIDAFGAACGTLAWYWRKSVWASDANPRA
jgi:VanZ family protein